MTKATLRTGFGEAVRYLVRATSDIGAKGLASECGFSIARARAYLHTLVALGLVSKQGTRYRWAA